jgi:DNA-binding NarL/FixJ family response regulator
MDVERQYVRTLRAGLLAAEPIRRTGLRSILEEMRGIELLEGDIDALLGAASLDVAVVSLTFQSEILETLERLRSARPDLRTIIMSPEADDESMIAAISAGAKGYLPDMAAPEEVRQAVELVASGTIWAPRRVLSLLVDRMLAGGKPLNRSVNPQFTQREMEVLELLVSARSNREIAQALGIEVRTVKSYVGRMMRKVGVGNRIALSIHAAKNSLTQKS